VGLDPQPICPVLAVCCSGWTELDGRRSSIPSQTLREAKPLMLKAQELSHDAA